VYIENLGEIEAVAFDIDGTLYRDHSLNIRVLPHIISHSRFFLSYNKTRKDMHKFSGKSNFHTFQMELLAKRLKCSPEEAELKVKNTVHDGLKKYFARMKPCSGVVDLIADLKKQGLKIALLSDLPPSQKGDIWGIKELCDVMLWTEDAGALKPSAIPFQKMVEQLNVPAEKILYVGNNHKYDVIGAKNAGMKTAWIVNPIAAKLGKKSKEADITFGRYKQLRNKLLF